MKEVYAHAEKAGIRIAIEPLNRFETYLINRGDQALALADAVGPNCGVCLDLFHMNIEESDIHAAFRKCQGPHLRHPHRRQQPLRAGHGHAGLSAPSSKTIKEVGYTGALTLEFVATIDRTPASPYGDQVETNPVDVSPEQLKFIIDHGSNLLSDKFYTGLFTQSVKVLRPLMLRPSACTRKEPRMLFGKLFHTAIKTADLDATVRFYTEVLGMVVADRPPIGFPGAWLKPAQAGRRRDHPPLRGRCGDGARRFGADRHGGDRPCVRRVPGLQQLQGAVREASASTYRENLVPATPLWQLFVYDPNGVQLELTFHAAAEREPPPVIAAPRRYSARERWFQPELYRQFCAR